VKKRTIRTASVIAAVLLVGTVAFAAAQTVQPLRSSQIPVVVTASPAAESSETSPSRVATAVVPTVAPVPVAASPKATSDAPNSAHSSTRELVTPKMRDDSDADSSGGPSDGDADDAHPTSSGSSEQGDVREGTRPSQDRKTDTNSNKSNVQEEHSSGKN